MDEERDDKDQKKLETAYFDFENTMNNPLIELQDHAYKLGLARGRMERDGQ